METLIDGILNGALIYSLWLMLTTLVNYFNIKMEPPCPYCSAFWITAAVTLNLYSAGVAGILVWLLDKNNYIRL